MENKAKKKRVAFWDAYVNPITGFASPNASILRHTNVGKMPPKIENKWNRVLFGINDKNEVRVIL